MMLAHAQDLRVYKQCQQSREQKATSVMDWLQLEVGSGNIRVGKGLRLLWVSRRLG